MKWGKAWHAAAVNPKRAGPTPEGWHDMSEIDRVEENGLSPVQSKALAVLLESRTVTDAAEACGVSERTLRRWLADDDKFKAALAELQAAAFRVAVARMGRLMGKAMHQAEADLDGGGRTASRVALTLIRKMAGLAEFADLDARLTKLEGMVNREGKGKD